LDNKRTNRLKPQKNKLIYFSGCSGAGKSTLLAELSKQGYAIIPEVGREVYKDQLNKNVDVTSLQNQIAIAEIIIAKSVENYHQAEKMRDVKDNLIFFDRSFLECVSFYRTLKIADANKYDNLIHDLKFHSPIFMTPPWEEIFCQDEERRKSFDNAVGEYEHLFEFFTRQQYKIIEVPKLSVKERCEFVLSVIPDDSVI
jgi:predicted ATPase